MHSSKFGFPMAVVLIAHSDWIPAWMRVSLDQSLRQRFYKHSWLISIVLRRSSLVKKWVLKEKKIPVSHQLILLNDVAIDGPITLRDALQDSPGGNALEIEWKKFDLTIKDRITSKQIKLKVIGKDTTENVESGSRKFFRKFQGGGLLVQDQSSLSSLSQTKDCCSYRHPSKLSRGGAYWKGTWSPWSSSFSRPWSCNLDTSRFVVFQTGRQAKSR